MKRDLVNFAEDLQRAKSIRLPILESPRLSSEVSESKGSDMLRSHLQQCLEKRVEIKKNVLKYDAFDCCIIFHLEDNIPSVLSIAELDRNASAMLMPLSIEGLLTRLLSRLPALPFCDKLK